MIDDCRRLTSRAPYRIFRKIRVITKIGFGLVTKNQTIQNDVLPMNEDSWRIIGEVIALDLQIDRYLLMHPDIAVSRINPITHYLMHGKNEGRELPTRKIV